jgi:glycosyltransferase involved in cell wall biosynthesis
MQPSLLIDDSLSLINRTGAFFVARDITAMFANEASIRRWRSFGSRPGSLVAKIQGRLMLKEIDCFGTSKLAQWPDAGCDVRLFLDPLYVTRSKLDSSDVVVCYDIGPISHPELFSANATRSYRAAYEKIAVAKPGLVFVSQTSRNAFEKEYGRNFAFLEVIPLYAREGTDFDEPRPIHGIPGPFFLGVGAMENRKNHAATILAFRQSGLGALGVSLVICGPRGDASEQLVALAADTPGVMLIGYVTDAQLRWLYESAIAFVLPSRLEGFGMPALEAARYGLPPIISDDSALNEAVGGLGLAIPSESSAALSGALLKLHAMPDADRLAWANTLKAYAAENTRERFMDRWRALMARVLAGANAGVSPVDFT